MHVFLTGEKGIGKSTVVRRTVALLGVVPGGFVTRFGPDRGMEQCSLYLCPPWLPPSYEPQCAVARWVGGRPLADTAAFNRLGCEALRMSASWAKLLVLDECGLLERQALEFQAAVRGAAAGAVPTLGVIKPARDGTWLAALADCSGVTVVTVTEDNRAQLPEELAGRYARHITADGTI